ncbi:MAG: hypothetical protein GX496_04375 [Firmicutes bacterium]|nr:hypothetical protein [Bacillota bacterium]
MERETLNREAFVAVVEGRALPEPGEAAGAEAGKQPAQPERGERRRLREQEGLLEPPATKQQPRPAEG